MTAENSAGQVPDKERLIKRNYSLTVHKGSDALYEFYGEDMLQIHRDVFGPLFRDSQGWPAGVIESDSQMQLESNMFRPRAHFVTLIDTTSDKVVGFTYSVPDNPLHDSPPEDEEYRKFREQGMSLTEYKMRQRRTATIGHTMIRPEHRSLTNWLNMLDTLETTLVQSGRYDEMTSAVREENHLAQFIRRRYQGRIVSDIPNQQSPIGPQSYFRIKVKK